MHIDYNNPIIWLEHRFSTDEDARNPNIEKKFIEYFSERDRLSILDAGAGTGNNFRYFFKKLGNQHQEWILLEQDGEMIANCRDKLSDFAREQGYHFSQDGDYLVIEAKEKKASIQLLQGQLQNIRELADMENLDVVTANALFDLVSYDQFDTFASQLACYQVCLMATLNYYETSFLPFSEDDGRYLNYFHTHMTRPQDFGEAMGPNCSEEMLDLLAAHEMKSEQESSQWHLKRYDTTMQHYILHFFENAIRDLNLSENEVRDMEVWLSDKKKMSHEHELEIIVDHSDIFAYPW